jgi:membrane protease YdiL (CAAX protease family)
MNDISSEALPSVSGEQAALPPKPTLRRLFFGDDGLRAGWSVLLFFLILLGLSALSNYLIVHFHLLPKFDPKAPQPKEIPFRRSSIGEGMSFLVLALSALVMSLVERRPFGRYGLTAKRMPFDFATGLFWGLLCLSLLVGAMVLTHSLSFDGVLLHGAVAYKDAAEWFIGFLLVGLSEEFLFRGYLQYTVSRGIAGITRALDPTNRHSFQWGFWGAAFLFSGIFFMLAHIGNSGESVSGIISVGLAGAVFAFSLYRTGSLWWAIGFHTTWDWAQSYLYGVFDSGTMVEGHLMASHPTGLPLLSGGSAGPEGSLLCIPAFLLIFAIIHFTLPKRDYFLTPDQSPLKPH